MPVVKTPPRGVPLQISSDVPVWDTQTYVLARADDVQRGRRVTGSLLVALTMWQAVLPSRFPVASGLGSPVRFGVFFFLPAQLETP